jgi:hypothetical protein
MNGILKVAAKTTRESSRSASSIFFLDPNTFEVHTLPDSSLATTNWNTDAGAQKTWAVMR